MVRFEVINELERRINEMYKSPDRLPVTPRKKQIFLDRIYKHWAANEYLYYVVTSKKSASVAATEFIKMMDEFCCNAGRNSYLFSIAYDVAVDLTDYLYSKGGC